MARVIPPIHTAFALAVAVQVLVETPASLSIVASRFSMVAWKSVTRLSMDSSPLVACSLVSLMLR